jgi:hypothetical protein
MRYDTAVDYRGRILYHQASPAAVDVVVLDVRQRVGYREARVTPLLTPWSGSFWTAFECLEERE